MEDSELNYSHPRSRSIEEGIPIDVSEAVKTLDIQWSISITEALYSRFISPDTAGKGSNQIIQDRLYWILYSLIIAIRLSGNDNLYIHFSAPMVLANGQIAEVQLLAVI